MLTTLLLAGVVLLVGAGASLALYGPDELSVPARLALTFCLGYAVSAGLAFGLAAVGLLHALSMLIALLVVVSVAYLVAAKRFSLRRHALEWYQEVRGSRLLALGLLVLVGFAIYRATFPAELNFLQSTAFRYWADGTEIADSAGIPDRVLHWGRLYPPTVSKVLPNSFTAAVSFVTDGRPLQGLGFLLWFGSTALAVALWGLAHELGLKRTAILVPILLLVDPGVLNHEMTADLITYKIEIVGRMVAFVALLMGVRALRGRGSRLDLIVVGVLLAVAAATHVTPFVVVVIALLLYALARALLSRQVKTIALRLGVAFLVCFPLIFAIPFLSGGDLGFEGVKGNDAYSSFEGEGDPTAFFADPRSHLNEKKSTRTNIPSPGRIIEGYAASAVGRHLTGWGAAGAAFVFAILTVVVARDKNESLRAIALIAGGLAISLLALSVLFVVRYDTYIPAATGIRRLFDYSAMPIILVLGALAERGIVYLQRRHKQVANAALATVVVALFAGSVAATLPSSRARTVTASSTAPFEWIGDNTPCGSRILATSRTEGVFQAMTGRSALLEGMSPYLRPSMLREVIELTGDAHAFFSKPRDRAEFLAERDVDYVYVKGRAAMGGARIAPKNVEVLTELPFLRSVYSSSAATIFEVLPPYDGAQEAVSAPGYFCDASSG